MHQRDVTVAAGPADAHRAAGFDEGRAFQHRLDRVDRGVRQRRQVRQGLLADLPVRLAERPAQQPRLTGRQIPPKPKIILSTIPELEDLTAQVKGESAPERDETSD